MKSALALVALASAMAMMLVHCAAHDDAVTPLDAAETDAVAEDADARTDAGHDADAPDAAARDQFELPDGSVTCEVSPCAVALVNGSGAFCALLSDKTVQCWGLNVNQMLGYATSGLPWSTAPRRLALSNIVDVHMSSTNACALDESGSVFCWGAQDLVNAGMDPDASAPLTAPALPTRQDLVPQASALAVGSSTACVTTKTGSMSCWGKNEFGQLARKTTTPFAPPSEIQIPGKKPLTPWASGVAMFATTADGDLFSWGSSICPPTSTPCSYLIGRESSEPIDYVPTVVRSLSNVRFVATDGLPASVTHMCAIAGRYVWCWGDNTQGQLGTGYATNNSQLPVRTILSDVVDADDVAAGNPKGADVPMRLVSDGQQITCAIMSSSRVYCWGPFGGDGSIYGRPRKMKDSTLAHLDSAPSDVVSIASVGATACALRRSGEVDCWGSNNVGFLGRGNEDVSFSDPQPAPVEFAQ